jgi:hypothetical protein
MIGKGPGWSHSLHLIELVPELTNLLKFDSQGALQQQLKLHSLVFLWHENFTPKLLQISAV